MGGEVEVRIKHLVIPLILLIPVAIQASEVRAGILFHDSGGVWGNSRKESGGDLNCEVLFGGRLFRPNIGISYNLNEYTSKIYAGCVIQCSANQRFISLALGGAIHNGEIHSKKVKSLGSKLLFRLALEVGFYFRHHSLSLILDHISNANMARWNDGLETLGIRFGWSY